MTTSKKPEARVVTIDVSGLGEIAAFGQLSKVLRSENRYFLPKKQAQFVEGLLEACNRYRATRLRRGTYLYRARRHDVFEGSAPVPFEGSQLLAPPPHKAVGGRLNPTGIPYLYTARAERTAAAEARPWLGSWLTIARLQLERGLRVADFTKKKTKQVVEKLGAAGLPSSWMLWDVLDFAFAHPVAPGDDVAYVVTQHLSEGLKDAGLDGVMYDSSLHKGGVNVALFRGDEVRLAESYQLKAKTVQYRYQRRKKA